MEATAKSGWLSKEQLATSEFARRVAVKHGIGVVASLLKRKEDQVRFSLSFDMLFELAVGVRTRLGEGGGCCLVGGYPSRKAGSECL